MPICFRPCMAHGQQSPEPGFYRLCTFNQIAIRHHPCDTVINIIKLIVGIIILITARHRSVLRLHPCPSPFFWTSSHLNESTTQGAVNQQAPKPSVVSHSEYLKREGQKPPGSGPVLQQCPSCMMTNWGRKSLRLGREQRQFGLFIRLGMCI